MLLTAKTVLTIFAAFLAATSLAADAAAERPPSESRILMTVGGVGYNTNIVRALDADPAIDLVVRSIDDDPVLFTEEALRDIDAVLIYHRDNTAEPAERDALMNFLRRGGGVVVLHHAIANYPDWPEWQRRHVGGLYVLDGHEDLPPSRYFPDFTGVAVRVGSHPITEGIASPWRYDDEGYIDLWVSDSVKPLLRTTAFGSDPLLAWIGPSKAGRVVFVQPGHGEWIMRDPTYLRLVKDALAWTAGED